MTCNRLSVTAVLYAALLLTVSCATTVTMASLTPSERMNIQARHYDKSDSVLFSASAAALLNLEYTMQLSDRDAGVLQTAPRTYPPDPNQDAMAEALLGFAIRYRRSVSVRIEAGEVKVSITWESSDRYGWRPYEPKVEVARSEYATVQAAIREEVEKRAYESGNKN